LAIICDVKFVDNWAKEIVEIGFPPPGDTRPTRPFMLANAAASSTRGNTGRRNWCERPRHAPDQYCKVGSVAKFRLHP
jgi:hypothetical protein